jgi:deazaflavin-dependent oxidoreductase (nitroreductase family)
MASQPHPWTKTEMAVAEPLIKVMSRVNTWAYRVTNGRIGGKFMRGAPVLLLTTVGRKTGAKRVAPLIYARDGERVLIVASKGGMDHHPLWYRNLVAHPEVEVQIGADVRTMTAHTATPAEKAALWPKVVAVYRDYADYQARTTRDIPVVVLTPR